MFIYWYDLNVNNVPELSDFFIAGGQYGRLEDAETGERILMDSSNREVRRLFSQKTSDNMVQRQKLFKTMNMDSIVIRTDQSYFEPLMRFFRIRAKRFR